MPNQVNINQIELPSVLASGPGGELLSFDASGQYAVVAPGDIGDILISGGIGGLPNFVDPLTPGSLSIAAENVTYDNAVSLLTATDVQAAIDEMVAGGVGFDIDGLPAGIAVTGDIIAFSGASVGGTETRMTVDQLAVLMTSLGVGAGSGVNFVSGTYTNGASNPDLGFNGTTDDTLDLPATAAGEEQVFVYFDGIFQHNTTWALITAGTQIQFDAFIPGSTLEVEIRVAEAGGGSAPVDSVFGRIGAVVAVASDYDADQIDYDNATSGLTATDVQAAIDEIDATVDGISGGFDIDALPAAGALAGADLAAVSQGTVESKTSLTDLATFFGSIAFDIDALPAGTADDTADLMAISDQSDTGTEKSITLAALAGLIGGGSILGMQTFIGNGTYTPTVGTSFIVCILTGAGGSGQGFPTAGNDGTDSTFAGATAGGGQGGGKGGATAYTPNTSFSALGAGNLGQIISGGSGSPPHVATIAGNWAIPGPGGSSFFGSDTARGSGGGGSTITSDAESGGGGGAAGDTCIFYSTTNVGGGPVVIGVGGAPVAGTYGSGRLGGHGFLVILEF